MGWIAKWEGHGCKETVQNYGANMRNFIPTAVRVNTFSAIPLIVLPPNCGGVFVTTQSKKVWLHHPCLLGVPIAGMNQPTNEWMWRK